MSHIVPCGDLRHNEEDCVGRGRKGEWREWGGGMYPIGRGEEARGEGVMMRAVAVKATAIMDQAHTHACCILLRVLSQKGLVSLHLQSPKWLRPLLLNPKGSCSSPGLLKI